MIIASVFLCVAFGILVILLLGHIKRETEVAKILQKQGYTVIMDAWGIAKLIPPIDGGSSN